MTPNDNHLKSVYMLKPHVRTILQKCMLEMPYNVTLYEKCLLKK